MKILVPLNKYEDIDRYCEAGADEFYFGYQDEEWIENFGYYADLNRMSSFGIRANSFMLEDALRAVKRISELDKASFLTLNANLYTDKEQAFIEKRLGSFAQAGLTGIIVSDYSLLECAQRLGLQAVASTMTGIFNADILNFYVKKGFKRVIVPRELKISEIKAMKDKHPDVAIEVFFMRNGCIYADNNCLCDHRKGAICSTLRRKGGIIASNAGPVTQEITDAIKIYDDKLYTGIACAQCALYRLKAAGVDALKIVGRADYNDSVIKNILITKQNLSILDNCSSEKEYLEQVIKPDERPDNCKNGYNCYYPEIFE